MGRTFLLAVSGIHLIIKAPAHSKYHSPPDTPRTHPEKVVQLVKGKRGNGPGRQLGPGESQRQLDNI